MANHNAQILVTPSPLEGIRSNRNSRTIKVISNSMKFKPFAIIQNTPESTHHNRGGSILTTPINLNAIRKIDKPRGVVAFEPYKAVGNYSPRQRPWDGINRKNKE